MTEPPADPTEQHPESFGWLEPSSGAAPAIGAGLAIGAGPAVGAGAVGSATVSSGALVVPESVPYEVQAYPMPAYNQTYPSQTYGRTYPAHVYPAQPSADALWPLVTGEPPPARRRPSLVLGLVIALVVLLAGGATAAFLLVGPTSSRGSAAPADAVEGFLGAIYDKHSAREAARYVCARARNDPELDQIVFAVKTFEQEYASARTTWSYPEIRPTGQQATASVTLTLTTANEQVAEKKITLLLVDDRGWWVCDVQTPT